MNRVLLSGLALSLLMSAPLVTTPALAQNQDPDPNMVAPTQRQVAVPGADVEAAKPAGERGIEFARDLYLDFGSDASLRKIPKSEIEKLRLGKPVRHYMIRLDHLKAYEQGAPINSVLTHLAKFTFPILAPSGAVGQVTVTREDGSWEVLSVGGYRRIKNTLNALDYASNADGSNGTLRAMVSIPALNMRFLATSHSGQAWLTRIRSRSMPSEPRPAEDLLAELSVRAQSVENLPH